MRLLWYEDEVCAILRYAEFVPSVLARYISVRLAAVLMDLSVSVPFGRLRTSVDVELL